MHHRQLPIGISLLLLLATFCSCSNSFQQPSEYLLMGVEEPKQLRVGGYFAPGLGDQNNNSFGGQFIYSPIKHLSISGSQSFSKIRFYEPNIFASNSNRNNKISETSIAIGTYKNVFEGSSIDFRLGIDRGSQKATFTQGLLNTKFNRYFVHVGSHHWDNHKFRFSFGLRLSYLDFLEANIDGFLEPQVYNQVSDLKEGDPYFQVEPSLRIEYGGHFAKCFASTNVNMTTSQITASGIAQLGIVFSLHNYKKFAAKELQ